MILWVVSILGLVVCACSIVRALLAVPSRRALAAQVGTTALPAADGVRTVLGKLVPTSEQIVGHAPRLPLAQLMARPGAPPSEGAGQGIDLTVVGIADDREAQDRELWLLAKKSLPARPRNT